MSGRSKRLIADAAALEDRLLSASYADAALDTAAAAAEGVTWRGSLLDPPCTNRTRSFRHGRRRQGACPRAGAAYEDLCLDLYAQSFNEPDLITLAVYGEKSGFAAELPAMYDALARQRGFVVGLFQIARRETSGKTAGRAILLGGDSGTLQAKRVHVSANPAETILQVIREVSIGIALEIRGRMCYPLFVGEEGLHLYRNKGKTVSSLVHAANAAMTTYCPPPRIERKDGMKNYSPRRVYDDGQEKIEDVLLGESPHWSNRDLAVMVGPLLDARFRAEIKAWLEQ